MPIEWNKGIDLNLDCSAEVGCLGDGKASIKVSGKPALSGLVTLTVFKGTESLTVQVEAPRLHYALLTVWNSNRNEHRNKGPV